MNIAYDSSIVITPLKALRRWFATTPEAHVPMPAIETSCNRHRPLRVLQVLEADQSPRQLGRMRISGRMADVCAELDRLASRETHWH